jgi:uncharacterized integral membrane protein
LGQYFDIDPIIVRLVFLIVAVFGGTGVAAYIILWILIPEEGEKREAKEFGDNIKEGANKMAKEIKEAINEKEVKEKTSKRSHGDGKIIGGMLIIVVGVIFLLSNLFPSLYLNMGKLWPLIVIVIGIGVIFGSGRKED